jgi:hypothetical protein
VAATGGNPLALGELAGALAGEQLAGRVPLPAQLPVTGGVERGFLDRIRRLDEAAQRYLLVVAADDTSRVNVVQDAALRLGASDGALDALERAGLLRVDGDALTLFHPLVRSAIYRAATSAQRRAAHRALAEVLTGDPTGGPGIWRRPRTGRTRTSPPCWMRWPNGRPAAGVTRPRPAPGPGPPS